MTDGVSYWENLHGIELTPIMGVHLWFDKPVDCPPALAILDRRIEWIFNKNRNFDRTAEENGYLSIVISASRAYTGLPVAEIIAMALAEVRECLPETKQANLLRSRVIRWPKATISPKPGVDALRPDQRSPIENLYVAGEWTNTGWPSTMEGAARSGYLAAEYILAAENRPEKLLAPDLPVSGLSRLLMRR